MDGSQDGPASRGDVWIDVSQPAPNAGIVDLVDDRDRVSGKVQRVRVVVGTFGGMATSNVTLSVRSPDGAVRTHPVEAWDGPTGSVDVIPSLPGRYTFHVNPGGAYRYDDEAAIDVPPSGPVRVDWRVARREWLTRLGWTEDRDNPDLRVLPSIEMLDSRPAIVLGSGYAPRTRTGAAGHDVSRDEPARDRAELRRRRAQRDERRRHRCRPGSTRC